MKADAFKDYIHSNRDYWAGNLAGIGVGILLTGYLLFREDMWIELREGILAGYLLIGIGSIWERYLERSRKR